MNERELMSQADRRALRHAKEREQLQEFLDVRTTDADLLFSVGSTEIYKAYVDWCAVNRLRSLNQQAFGTHLGRMYEKRRASKGIVYLGIKLRLE